VATGERDRSGTVVGHLDQGAGQPHHGRDGVSVGIKSLDGVLRSNSYTDNPQAIAQILQCQPLKKLTGLLHGP
jgi:hypothetical protein